MFSRQAVGVRTPQERRPPADEKPDPRTESDSGARDGARLTYPRLSWRSSCP